MGVVDEGRPAVAEEIGPGVAIHFLELGIADDDQSFAFDSMGDQLVDHLLPGNEAVVEPAVIGVIGHAAVARAMRYLGIERDLVGGEIALGAQAGPFGRDDEIAALEQVLVRAQTQQSRGRQHAVERAGHQPRTRWQGKLVPGDPRGVLRRDQRVQPLADRRRGIGDDRLVPGMEPRVRRRDPGKVRHLVRGVVIEKEERSSHRGRALCQRR